MILRLLSRRLHRGAWKRLQLDDYLIVLAMVRLHDFTVPAYTDRSQLTDTILVVYMSKVVVTSSNLIRPEEASNFSEAEIKSRTLGSKYVLVVEQMQIATIWLVKACLLIMYFRMTTVLPHDYGTTAAQIGCRDFYLRRRLFRHHGDTLSWRVVSSIQPVLGCAYALK